MGKPRPPKKPPLNAPKKPKIDENNSLAAGSAKKLTVGDTTTDASEDDRTRKIPKSARIQVSNQFNIDEDTVLSDYSDDESGKSVHVPRPKKIKVPPIVVVDKSAAELRTLVQKSCSSNNFTLRNMTVGTRIDIMDHTEHTTVKSALLKGGISFYTYHTPTTKQLKFVLHGLNEMNVNELKQLLSSNEIVPEDIKMLNIKHKRFDKQAVYLLYFAPQSMQLAKLKTIKHINHFAVKWEKYSPKQSNSIAQCRKCQRFGHSSVNCSMPPKCMVCAESHNTNDCNKRILKANLLQQQAGSTTQVDRSYIKCANCGNNHTSNYMGCEKRKAFLEAQEKIVNRRRTLYNKSKRLTLFDEHDFPRLVTNNLLDSQFQNQQAQPTWVEVLQGIKQEQSSANTVLNVLQTMAESMNVMMTKMTQLIEVLTTQLTNTGNK